MFDWEYAFHVMFITNDNRTNSAFPNPVPLP